MSAQGTPDGVGDSAPFLRPVTSFLCGHGWSGWVLYDWADSTLAITVLSRVCESEAPGTGIALRHASWPGLH